VQPLRAFCLLSLSASDPDAFKKFRRAGSNRRRTGLRERERAAFFIFRKAERKGTRRKAGGLKLIDSFCGIGKR